MFPSWNQFSSTTTIWAIFTWLDAQPSTLRPSTLRYTIISFESTSWRCQPATHQHTHLQTTDIFTKALRDDKLWQFTTNLGLSTTYKSRLRGSMDKESLSEPITRLEVAFEGACWEVDILRGILSIINIIQNNLMLCPKLTWFEALAYFKVNQ